MRLVGAPQALAGVVVVRLRERDVPAAAATVEIDDLLVDVVPREHHGR